MKKMFIGMFVAALALLTQEQTALAQYNGSLSLRTVDPLGVTDSTEVFQAHNFEREDPGSMYGVLGTGTNASVMQFGKTASENEGDLLVLLINPDSIEVGEELAVDTWSGRVDSDENPILLFYGSALPDNCRLPAAGETAQVTIRSLEYGEQIVSYGIPYDVMNRTIIDIVSPCYGSDRTIHIRFNLDTPVELEGITYSASSTFGGGDAFAPHFLAEADDQLYASQLFPFSDQKESFITAHLPEQRIITQVEFRWSSDRRLTPGYIELSLINSGTRSKFHRVVVDKSSRTTVIDIPPTLATDIRTSIPLMDANNSLTLIGVDQMKVVGIE